ncbi:MAG: hypothetical protein NW237_16255 [Cyanobacteriota bacterium]|nr:hypothetical protein [Cyanobacteriota bacterium]
MATKKKEKPHFLQQVVRAAIRGGIRQINQQINEIIADPQISTPVQGSEAWYRDKLAKKLKGQVEVVTPSGRIDILTDREVIEVKKASNWKAAIGQILVYGRNYPNHKKRIHLFGELTKNDLKKIKEECNAFGILLTWE